MNRECAMDEKQTEMKPDTGVFVTKGMKVSIPSFSITLGKDGSINPEPVIIHTGLDMTPYWLRIAFQHLLSCELAHEKLINAKSNDDDEEIANALENEFSSGMQAIMASGIGIDAYYASVKEHIDISENMIKKWRENKTARFKQIAEILRRAFPLSQDVATKVRDILKQNLKFRDKAVHPEYGTTAPTLHVELNKVTDWRYAMFRFYNAKAIVGLSLSIIYQTASRPHTNKYNELQSYCEELVHNLNPILEEWTKKYGKLF